MSTPSLWTDKDTAALKHLVRTRGMADVVINLREIARGRAYNPQSANKADWDGIMSMLTRIYDNVAEGRPLK